MVRAKTKAPKKSKKPRITITMTPELDRRLKGLAKMNQRSAAWVINYAIEEILEKYSDNPAPQLPVRSSPLAPSK
jgi:Ribbon-helix-helix protein, copG family